MLPAETLAESCYQGMFLGCTALSTAPVLSAKTLVEYCYCQMFSGCTALETTPVLPAETLAVGCYYEMFFGCTALSSVTMLATDVRAERCLENWLNEAGTNVQGAAPTLTLYNSKVYNQIQEQIRDYGFNYLPELWSYNIQYKYY